MNSLGFNIDSLAVKLLDDHENVAVECIYQNGTHRVIAYLDYNSVQLLQGMLRVIRDEMIVKPKVVDGPPFRLRDDDEI